MKAIVYRVHGDSGVLSLVEREPGEPGPGEVRVRIAVSGVNPTDWKARAATARVDLWPEIVPNQDGAGIVDATGEGVAHVGPGDRVWIFLAQYERPTGTAQEWAVLPAARVVRLPDEVGFEVGASLGVPAMTAHRALTVRDGGPARLSPGALASHTVLVTGGAGAVGHAAIQLARWAGATVLTTVSSPDKGDLARAAGADTIIDYLRDDVRARIREAAPEGVDHIVDVSIASNAGLDADVAAAGAAIAFYADDGGDRLDLPLRPSFAKNLRLQGVLLYTVGSAAWEAAAADITAALHAGALPVGIDAGLPLTWYPLEETAAAHDAVQAGAVGKVLIRVADL